jgi:hypothetical protein
MITAVVTFKFPPENRDLSSLNVGDCRIASMKPCMSALGQKRSAPQNVMFALPLKADMCAAPADVGYGPIADSARDSS